MTKTLRDSLLPAIDKLRGLPGRLGLRLFTVTVVARVWDGSRFGLGNSVDSQHGIKVDLGIFPTKVRALTTQDIIASGGAYQDQDMEVGPFTPAFVGSDADSNSINVFDMAVGTSPTEIFFNIRGPGYAGYVDAINQGTGSWFKKISQRVDRPFRYTFVVRKTAEDPVFVIPPVIFVPPTNLVGLGVQSLPLGLGNARLLPH